MVISPYCKISNFGILSTISLHGVNTISNPYESSSFEWNTHPTFFSPIFSNMASVNNEVVLTLLNRMEWLNVNIDISSRQLVLLYTKLISFWIEAVVTANSLMNRLPTKVLHMMTPYTRLYRSKPDYEHLKVFGCLCFLYPTRHNKFLPTCVFLGYSPNHKGYRCDNLQTGKFITSRHVRFHKMNYATLIPTA